LQLRTTPPRSIQVLAGLPPFRIGLLTLIVATVQWDCLPSAVNAATQLWTPAEPLLWADQPPASEALSLAVLSEHTPALGVLRRRIPAELTESQNVKLQQLLEFLDANDVDICVLPEYALLPSTETFEILAGFAPTIAIVAGIGLPRTDGLEALEPYVSSSLPASNNNCVVVFSGEDCHVVTKRHAAAGEVMDPGDGPSIVELELKGAPLRLGVAICMDYVAEGHNVGSLQGQVDLLAIPALSAALGPFRPDAPRDFPRVFANTAKVGGSTIYASGCTGPLLTQGSPTPLPATTEGIIALQWEGQAQKPTGLRQSTSRLELRSAIITTDAPADKHKIAQAFLALSSSGSLPDSDQQESLARWSQRLAQAVPDDDALRSAVALYRRAVADDTLTGTIAFLIRRHLILRGVTSQDAIRAEIASRCCREIQTALAGLKPSEGKYLQLLEAAKEYGAVAGTKQNYEQVARVATAADVCYFALGLGPFDDEQAEATLSEQLDLLRSYARSGPPGSRIVFRLETIEDAATGQIHALFHIAAFGSGDSESVAYFKAFERLARPIYLRGWSISGGKTSLSEGGHATYICPDRGVPFQVRDDWGVLVDVLRSVGPGCDLELEGWRVMPDGSDEWREKESLQSQAEYGGSAVRRFFNLPPDATTLGIRIRLRSQTPNRALAELVGAVICGDGRFELQDEQDAPDPVPTPVNRAHRVLHPPHGHIEGRGIEPSAPLNIPLREDVPPKPGAPLGEAIVARPFVDDRIEIVLPDAGRTLHTYIVGRTGSGKTNTLKNIARHDLHAGGPVIVIDPHGELYDYAVRHMGRRVASSVAIDLSSVGSAPCLNPLYLDANDDDDRKRNVDELVEVLIRQGHYDWYGPRFTDLVQLSVESVHVDARQRGVFASLFDVLELFGSTEMRARVDRALRDAGRQDLQARWARHRAMKDTEQAEVEQWFLSKIEQLSTSRILHRAFTGQPTVALTPTLRAGGVVLIRVPEIAVGSIGASVVGGLLLERIVRFAFQGGFTETPRPASMIVDEFQKFVGREFERLVPEARKFNIGLIMANQTLSQLSAFDIFKGSQNAALQSLILGNVGNFIVQSVGQQDASVFAQELGLTEQQLRRIGRYSAVVSVSADGLRFRPFTVSLADSRKLPGASSEAVATDVVERRMQEVETDLTKPSDAEEEDAA
jgi:hypothetical protein